MNTVIKNTLKVDSGEGKNKNKKNLAASGTRTCVSIAPGFRPDALPTEHLYYGTPECMKLQIQLKTSRYQLKANAIVEFCQSHMVISGPPNPVISKCSFRNNTHDLYVEPFHESDLQNLSTQKYIGK